MGIVVEVDEGDEEVAIVEDGSRVDDEDNEPTRVRPAIVPGLDEDVTSSSRN